MARTSYANVGRVDSLFDRRYENQVGFLAPGLSAFGGVRVSL